MSGNPRNWLRWMGAPKGAEAPAVPEIPKVVCGADFRFQLQQKLGAGGFGSVFEAICLDADDTDRTPPKRVAVKVIRLNSNQNLRRSIQQELASLLAIRSDHIPRVYDWALQEDFGFVAMQLYDWGTLTERMYTHGALSDEEAWTLMRDLLSALKDAHAASILHLDIKPSNVLLREEERYALADFGISRGSSTGSTPLPHVGMGTRHYFAPEQRRRELDAIDMRTDLYGVGSTVWAAYTGKRLSNKVAGGLIKLSEGQKHALPSPAHFRPNASPELLSVLMQLLCDDPRQRPGSAAEALVDIERAMSTQVVPPEPGIPVPEDEAARILLRLIDPLWLHLFNAEPCPLRKIMHGSHLCKQGERSHATFILLSGRVEVLIDGRSVAFEDREGTFLGEVSALTGNVRTATLRAHGDVIVRSLNASQLERFVTQNPAVGIRLLRSMAQRLERS